MPPADDATPAALHDRTDQHAEERLAGFWERYVDDGRRGASWLLAHARRTVVALADLRRLPVVDAAPGDTAGGRAVRAVLAASASYGVPARLLGSAVLEVPADPDDYLEGRRARTVRRKRRAASRQGLRVRRVRDQAERRRLLELADRAEQSHPDPAYRVDDPDNDDLLEHDVWLTVEDPDGRPVLLAVAPYDDEFAVLRYFRTLGSGEAQSDARYLATSALVAELSTRGVRYLLDTATPPEQTNGLRHFQRMVGFRYARVRLDP